MLFRAVCRFYSMPSVMPFSAFEFPKAQRLFIILFYVLEKKRRNKMKKILSLVLAIAMSLCLLCACTKNDPEGNATLVIATEEKQVYDIPLSKLGEGKGLMPVFEYLKAEEGLEYNISGTMINGIGGLENDSETGRYIYIFTSVEADFDVSEYKKEVEYESATLVSAGVGFDKLTVADGAIIYIGLVTW